MCIASSEQVFIPDPMPDPELAVDAEDVLMEIEFFEFPDRPHYHLDKYPTNQRYQIEIWCEKSFSSLDRLAEEYGAVFQKGKGEMALACAHMLTERRKKYNRPVRIFYIHDLDPSGHGMPVSVARKLEFLLEDIRGNEDVPDVKLYNLVLTKEQVLHYDLPPAPVKSTDPRKNAWEVQFGKDIVELNALEEMHKGALARIVRNAIRHYYDTQLGVRAYQAQAAFKEYLEEIEQGVYDEFPELEELEDAYDTLVAQVEPELKRINDGIAVTWQRISDRLNEEMPDIEEYLEENPLPVARAAEELPDPLYDSTRDEFNQLAIYKQHQGKRIVF